MHICSFMGCNNLGQMIKRYGASVSPFSTPATMSKYSVSPSGERTYTLVFL